MLLLVALWWLCGVLLCLCVDLLHPWYLRCPIDAIIKSIHEIYDARLTISLVSVIQEVLVES